MPDTTMLKPVMPKEHGLWAWVLVPLLCGGLAAGAGGIYPLFFLCVFFFFLSLTPVRVFYKAAAKGGRPPARTRLWAGIYLGAGLAVAVTAAQEDVRILWVLAPFAPLFIAAIRLSGGRGQKSFAFEFGGIALLSLLAPTAAYAAQGAVGRHDLAVWLLILIFMVDRNLQARNAARNVDWLAEGGPTRASVRFVYRINVFIALAGIVAASAVMEFMALPRAVIGAFFPGFLVTALFTLSPPRRLTRIGWGEVVTAALFILLLPPLLG